MDAFDLCRETFGEIPGRWLKHLEALNTGFSEDQLTQAFARTKAAGGKGIAYVRTVAEQLRDEAQQDAPPDRRQRLICEQCHRPKWIDELSERNGQAICGECAGPAHVDPPQAQRVAPDEEQAAWLSRKHALDVQFAADWAEALTGIPQPLERLRTRMAELSKGSARDRADAWRRALEEISPAAVAVWNEYRRQLIRLGPMPIGPASAMTARDGPGEAAALSPTARKVKAFWNRVEAL